MRRAVWVWAAIALTIWIDVADVVLRAVPDTFADRFENPITVIMLSFYPLMALRWGLVLMLLVGRIRVRPFRFLPSAFPLQVTVLTAGHAVLGVLSLIGWLAWMVSSDTGSHVVGFVLHITLPTLIVFALARSSSVPERGASVPK